MTRRTFIARTLAAFAAVVALPRRLFAAPAKPLDFAVTTPNVILRACDFEGGTLAKLAAKAEPASSGVAEFAAAGKVEMTGVINHFDLYSGKTFIGRFPVTDVPCENGFVMDNRNAIAGGDIKIDGRMSAIMGDVICSLYTT